MKKIVALLMALTMVFALVACDAATNAPATDTAKSDAPATDTAKSDAPDADELPEIELVAAYPWSSTTIEHEYFLKIAEEVKARSNGKLTIKCMADGVMGSEAECDAQAISGAIDITLSEGAGWADAAGVPVLSITGLPYMYTTYEGLMKAGLEVLPDVFQELLDQNNVTLKCLTPFSAGLRSVWTNTKPVRTLADFAGMKIRCPEIKLFSDTIVGMGANPTPIAFSDLYTALNQGVVDGFEMDAATGFVNNLFEVSKYYTKTNHIGSLNIVCMNKDKFDSLPAEYQELLLAVFKEYAALEMEEHTAMTQEYEKQLADKGIEVIDLSKEDIDQLVENMQFIYDEYDEAYGVGDLIDQLCAIGRG